MTGRTRQQDQAGGRANTRAASWLAWALAGLSAALYLASIPLYALARSAHVSVSWGADLSVAGLLGWGLFLAFPIVGALIASRHPRNPIGWICLAVGALWMFLGMSDYYVVYGVARPDSVPFPLVIAGINNWLWVPTVGLLGTYLILLFPGGRLPSKRWLPIAWLSGAVILLLSVGVALTPEPLQSLGGTRNPFGLEGHPRVAYAAYAVLPLLPLCMLASALSLVLRYRRSSGEERQQIKWIAFAASFVGLLYLIGVCTTFLFPEEAWFSAGAPWWLDIVTYAVLLSLTAIPVAAGFAVLKYRLYDIDLLINRALVYGSLTVSLAAVYVGSVAGLQAAFRDLTGQGSTLAIAASTLAIAALFNPLRQRVQAFVDRRFYRRKYDAAQTLEAFGSRLRDETDLETLSGDLVGVARRTVQPAHVTLWLRPDAEPGTRSAAIEQSGHDGE